MGDHLLFVFAEDANPYITEVMSFLRQLDIDCVTHTQLLKQARLGTTVISNLENMVISAKSVIIIATPKLKEDRYSHALIDYAAEQGNLFSVILRSQGSVLVPPNFMRGGNFLIADPDPAKFAEQLRDKIFPL